MRPADLESAAVRAALRDDAPDVALGILLCAIALGALLLYRFRTRTKDPAIAWFGVFAGLYGLRLLARTHLIPFLSDPLPRQAWGYLVAAITYAILVPAILFVREIFPAWRRSLRWALIGQGAFAAIGLLSDLWLRRPESLHLLNNLIVLGYFAAFGIAMFRLSPRVIQTRPLRYGLLAFGVAAAIGNLASMGLLRLPFDPETLGFAGFMAGLGAFIASRVIGNEERLVALDKELEIARKIQNMLLPRESPRAPGLRIAARYVPMTAVAGDFYDFLPISERRVGILIADVSGHGVPAALIASMVKIAAAGQQPHADRPEQVLEGINQSLAGKFKGQFVTAAYAFLDLEQGLLRYAAAGHPPLLWLHAGPGGTEELTQKSLVLGARAKTSYHALERGIAAGDRLMLYTDGLLEARNKAGEQFGIERLRTVLQMGDNAENAASEVMAAIGRWTGEGPREDDLTLVIVDVLTAGVSPQP